MPSDIDWREELKRFIRAHEALHISLRDAMGLEMPYYHVGGVPFVPLKNHEPILFTLK